MLQVEAVCEGVRSFSFIALVMHSESCSEVQLPRSACRCHHFHPHGLGQVTNLPHSHFSKTGIMILLYDRFAVGTNKIIYLKCLIHSLARSKYSVNITSLFFIIIIQQTFIIQLMPKLICLPLLLRCST